MGRARHRLLLHPYVADLDSPSLFSTNGVRNCWILSKGGRALAERIISGKYRLIRLLGEGAAGDVWEAQNVLVGRRVAVKVTDDGTPYIVMDPERRRRSR
jgi:serine/threonine protein kinase